MQTQARPSDFSPQELAEIDAKLLENLPQPGQDDALVNEQLDMLVAGRGPEDWRQQLQASLGTGFAAEAAISAATRQRIERLAAAYQSQGLADMQRSLPQGSQANVADIVSEMVDGPYRTPRQGAPR